MFQCLERDLQLFDVHYPQTFELSEFLTLIFADYYQTHKTFRQCMIHNKLFSIVTWHKITIFDADLRNERNCSKFKYRWRLLSYFILLRVTFDVSNVVL